MAGMAAGRAFTFLWWVATLFCRAPKACDDKRIRHYWRKDWVINFIFIGRPLKKITIKLIWDDRLPLSVLRGS